MKKSRRRCPGNCGRSIKRSAFSCVECWDRLPHHVQLPITSTRGKPMSRGKDLAWANGAEYLGKKD